MELPSVDIDGIDGIDGIELTYRTAGEGGLPVLVLQHALGEDGSDWNAVVEALPSSRTGCTRWTCGATGAVRSGVPTLWS